MTASRHTSRVTIDGTQLDTSRLTLDIDELRRPYAQASFTAALPSLDVLDRLDPRQSPPVRVTMRQQFNDARPLSAITADYAGQTIEAISVAPTIVNGDPSFETGVGLWEATEAGTTIAHSAAQAHSGAWSMEVMNPAGTLAVARTTDMFPIQTLVRWHRDLWIYPTTELDTASFRTYFYDADMAEYEWGGTARGSLPVGEWTRLSAETNVSGVETEHYHYARLEVRLTGTNPHAYVDDVTFRYGRSNIASLSAEYGIPYNNGGTRPPTEVRAELRLRNRTVDYAAGTVTVEAATPDALLLDYALVSDVPVEPVGPTVRDCCNLVLGHVLGTAVQPGTTGSEPVEPEALAWQPGERAWSYLDSVVGQAGLRLWCDELGLWHLENPTDYNVQGHVAMSPATLTGLRDGISRDRGQWADAVVVTYEWTDAAGERHTVHDVAGASGATRTIQMTIERPFPGYGLAGGRLRRAQAMGRTLDLDAVADYDTRPFKAVSVSTPAGTGLQTGIVSGVTWTQPDDTMTVRTRGIVTIGPNAWLYTPSGVAWDDDSLPGVSWENYRSTEEGL